MNFRQILITAVLLLMFAGIGTAMVAATWLGTHERIAANERATLLRKLSELIAPERYDNDLLDDMIEVSADLPGKQPAQVYRARRDGRPVALVMTAVAPDGYSGAIRLLVGINHDGVLCGVRVVAHRETPGLGDGIEEDRSDWIRQFDARSLENPPVERWRVRKDGGDFDQLTGATITPRAVVRAVKAALLYYRAHADELFAIPPGAETP